MMKRIYSIILTIVLLLTAMGVCANDYKGTMERHGTIVEYSFSGCNVTKKEGPKYGGVAERDMIVFIEGEVETGSNVTLSCRKVKGLKNYNEVTVEAYISTGGNNRHLQSTENNGRPASINFTVPDDAQTITLETTYKGKVGSFSSQVVLKVLKKVNVPTSGGTESGTITNSSRRISLGYSFSGGVVKKKEEKDNRITYECDILEGSTINVTANKISAPEGLDEVIIYHKFLKSDENTLKSEGKGSARLNLTLRPGQGSLGMETSMVIKNSNAAVIVTIIWNYIKKPESPTVVSDNFKWNDVAKDDRCPICNGQFSNYWFTRQYGQIAIICKSDPNKKPRTVEDILDVLYYNDYIITKGQSRVMLDYGDEAGVLIIEENTKVLLRSRLPNGSDRWEVYQGHIIGRHLNRSSNEMSFMMSNCEAKPTGTIFMLEDNGKMSRVYLLSGSMEVTSKKNNKKVTLKPGQVSTVNTNGETKVQKFDVNKLAKKYGITADELQGQAITTTTTTTSTTRRYEVERAIVKYKVTQGTTQGALAKVFDNYGKLEHRELRFGNQATLQIVQGTTTYNLDTKTKKGKKLTNAELNFLEPNSSQMQKHKLKKKGTATVLGKQCTVYANDNTEFYVWKGIVLKKVVRSGSTTTTIEATSIEQPTSVDSKYFKVPQGYSIK